MFNRQEKSKRGKKRGSPLRPNWLQNMGRKSGCAQDLSPNGQPGKDEPKRKS